MIKFNPENKELLTFGECLDPAMEITDQDEANKYLEDFILYTMKYVGKEAERICKINLGFWAGYFDKETRDRVQLLFKCEHPIFGVADFTALEILEMGIKEGERIKKKFRAR